MPYVHEKSTDREAIIAALDVIKDALETGSLLSWEAEIIRPVEPVPTDGAYARYEAGDITRYTISVELES